MRVTLRFFVAVTLVTTSLAQGPWAKKDWTQWSKDDCKKVLEDSPWAQRWSQSNSKVANFATRTQGTEGVGSESELTVYYVVQLRSARPIREAVVRQTLIANQYDKLSDEKKEAMRKQAEGFVNRSYDDVVVVHVIYGSNVQEYNRDLTAWWQTHYPEGVAPQEAFLHGPKGQKVGPLRMVSPRGGAQEFELIFPRMVDGRPIVEPGDKTIGVEFHSPALNGQGATEGSSITSTNQRAGQGSGNNVDAARVFVEFKADKMTLNGQLIY
jgi:hypothetical protein